MEDDDVTRVKQAALINQYEHLYDDYITNMKAARFDKAGASQKELATLADDIYENTNALPTSENSGYLEIKSKMERVSTAQAQQEYSEKLLQSSEQQYYALLTVAAFLTFGAIRMLAFTSLPSKIEATLFFLAIGLVLFFLF